MANNYDTQLGRAALVLPSRAGQIIDCGDYGVWWYKRPTGHTKTGARHRGETSLVVEWAYALRTGNVWATSNAVSGFISREFAETAAQEHVARNKGLTR